jgi:MFS family permease
MVVPSSRKRAGLQVAAGAALGSLLQGFNTGVIAGALLGISSEFGLAARPAVTGLIASSTTIGAVVGTACSGKLCDWVGRKRTLVLSSACFVLGGLLMAWSPGSEVLVAGRMTVGLAAGIVSSAVPTYIAECAEPAQRGALSTLPQLCVSSGILLSYLVGLGGLVLGHSWRVMLGLSLVPALFQALVVLSLPESPRWLLSKRNDEAGARVALERLRGHMEVVEP